MFRYWFPFGTFFASQAPLIGQCTSSDWALRPKLLFALDLATFSQEFITRHLKFDVLFPITVDQKEFVSHLFLMKNIPRSKLCRFLTVT